MNKWMLLVVFMLSLVLMVACNESPTTTNNTDTNTGSTDTTAKGDVVTVCKKCGEMKGTDNCCKDAATCEKCNLHKGSPGCCKDMSAGNVVCTGCGEFKGSTNCCKDAAKCEGCGLHKGSPGCCKLPKAEKATSATEANVEAGTPQPDIEETDEEPAEDES